MSIYFLSVKPASQNLSVALNICSTLNTNELIDLAISIGESKEIKCKEEWVTAIATVLERKCPTPYILN